MYTKAIQWFKLTCIIHKCSCGCKAKFTGLGCSYVSIKYLCPCCNCMNEFNATFVPQWRSLKALIFVMGM